MNFQDFLPKIRREPIEQHGGHDRKIGFHDLSPDQTVAVDEVLCNIGSLDFSLVRLGGYAGTGKSTLIPIISESLGDTSTTAFISFTGKAANVLQRKLHAAGIYAPGFVGTIHRLIYYPITDEDGRILRWERKGTLTTDDGLTPLHRIIIDEASMVGRKLLDDLLSYDVPILAVGDHGQLHPVQDESVISEPDVRLEKIHRQAADNPIIRLSERILQEGDIPFELPPGPEIQFVSPNRAYEVIGETYERLELNMAVLVRSNRLRKQLNTEARLDKEPQVGDVVICLRNSPPVFNGMRGIVQSIAPEGKHWYLARVLFPDDGLSIEGLLNRYQFGRERTIETVDDLRGDGVRYPRSTPLGLLFDFGLALTVHKAQGSAFDEVILYPEKWSRDKPEDYQRWVYTAVTRAAKKLTIVR